MEVEITVNISVAPNITSGDMVGHVECFSGLIQAFKYFLAAEEGDGVL